MNPGATDGLPPWLQGGAMVALAAIVWWEQRAIRKQLEAIGMILAALIGPEKTERMTRKSGRPLTPAPIENDRDSE